VGVDDEARDAEILDDGIAGLDGRARAPLARRERAPPEPLARDREDDGEARRAEGDDREAVARVVLDLLGRAVEVLDGRVVRRVGRVARRVPGGSYRGRCTP